MKKPFLEKVTTPTDASWALLDRRLEEEIPFEWHHHPEFELTLTLNSRGQRYIGNSIENYDDGDLVLVGPNLPHTWNSTEKINSEMPHIALVMWFKQDWMEALIKLVAELKPVEKLLTTSERGIVFSEASAQKVRPVIEEMRQLQPVERLARLLEILVLLSEDLTPHYLTRNPKEHLEVIDQDKARIELILDYIHSRYQYEVSISEVAALAGLSLSGFHRLFRRHMRMTLSDYITRLRIGQACSLLINTDQSIAYIADTVGYANLANFNRQFKALKKVTPREFRNRYY